MKIYIYTFESKISLVGLHIYVLASSELEADTYIEEFSDKANLSMAWDLYDYENLNIEDLDCNGYKDISTIIESNPKNKGIIHIIGYLAELDPIDPEDIINNLYESKEFYNQ